MEKFDEKQLYSLFLKNDLNEVSDFLKKFGLNSVDRDQRTMLMSAVVENKIDLVIFLLKSEVDVNLHDRLGLTALHFAVLENNLEIVKTLIDFGAEVDAVDDHGNTPLWRAVMTNDSDSDVAQYLISKGSDVNKKNKHGVSAIDLF